VGADGFGCGVGFLRIALCTLVWLSLFHRWAKKLCEKFCENLQAKSRIGMASESLPKCLKDPRAGRGAPWRNSPWMLWSRGLPEGSENESVTCLPTRR